MPLAALALMSTVFKDRPAFALELTDLKRFTIEQSVMPFEAVALSAPIDPGADWDELVASWTMRAPSTVGFTVDIRVLSDAGPSPFFTLARWSMQSQPFGSVIEARTSVNGQMNDFGSVDTDTLSLKAPARRVEVRLRFNYNIAEGAVDLKEVMAGFKGLTLSFRNSKLAFKDRKPNRAAWGQTIEAPRRSQMSYENGNVICSPTATSMLLAQCAASEHKPELDRDVPDVVAGVYDPAYKGTGNWSFNVSYASSIPGIKGQALRVNDLRDLEDLIVAGYPVACSVSYAMLRGKPAPEPNDGHLVVLVGFDKEGAPVFNDPGRSTEIRQTYEREAFVRAWSKSGRTIYLIRPEGRVLPKLSVGLR